MVEKSGGITASVIESAGLFARVASTAPALMKQRLDVLTPIIAECCRITFHSCESSSDGFRKIASGTAILPTSCMRLA